MEDELEGFALEDDRALIIADDCHRHGLLVAATLFAKITAPGLIDFCMGRSFFEPVLAAMLPWHIDKYSRFAYPRAFRQAAAPRKFGVKRPFLSIRQTNSILRNER